MTSYIVTTESGKKVFTFSLADKFTSDFEDAIELDGNRSSFSSQVSQRSLLSLLEHFKGRDYVRNLSHRLDSLNFGFYHYFYVNFK